jgi:hypothetical protein
MEVVSVLVQIRAKITAAFKQSQSSTLPELVAVSKFQADEKILNLYAEGQRIFGENYVQELQDKSARLRGIAPEIEFHFIGRLQTNKVKVLLPLITTLHSVDSLRLLLEVEKRARDLQKKIRVYFQVNIDEEESKGGFRPSDLVALESEVKQFSWIVPLGLMAIPDPALDPNAAFRRMKELSIKHGAILGQGLSIGMSSDYEEAIHCGATSVRIGSALFGERPKVHGA